MFLDLAFYCLTVWESYTIPLTFIRFYFQKLQQKLEQQKKKQQQQKKQQQKQSQKQPADHVKALMALEAELKDKLSTLGLMPPSSLAEVLNPLHLSKNKINLHLTCVPFMITSYLAHS
jgi:hypothetical protein